MWYATSNMKTQEMLISSGFWYIADFTIGFIIYELTSKQSHERKLKADDNEWKHKPCVRIWMATLSHSKSDIQS